MIVLSYLERHLGEQHVSKSNHTCTTVQSYCRKARPIHRMFRSLPHSCGALHSAQLAQWPARLYLENWMLTM